MNLVDIIIAKRDGKRLPSHAIAIVVRSFNEGSMPDYQMAAWLMAAFIRGLDREETLDLTRALVGSGKRLDLRALGQPVVDKHSTGGVGDKTTLVLAPLVAAAGVPVGKMSGRGLGFSGGTLDKLESIPGLRVDITSEEFVRNLREVGLVIAGQSQDLVPAEGKMYALRDVTGTVDSLPLIASSIVSKKVAAGASAVVLDVKVGRGAFMKREEDAIALAEAMIDLCHQEGLQARAIISAMDQPLGYAVGNALEVGEAIETLRGGGPPDLVDLCLALGAELLIMGGVAAGPEAARELLKRVLLSGQALQKFRQFVARQGGNERVVDGLDLLPRARIVEPLMSPEAGYLESLDAEAIGRAVVLLGGGRAQKTDKIDHAVGVVVHAKIGDQVQRDKPLLTVHANDPLKLTQARILLEAAHTIRKKPVPARGVLLRAVRGRSTHQR